MLRGGSEFCIVVGMNTELIKTAYQLGFQAALEKRGASTKVIERVLRLAQKAPAKTPLKWRLANAVDVWKTKPGVKHPVLRGRLADKGTAHDILGQLGKPVTYGDRPELLAALAGYEDRLGSTNFLRSVFRRLGIDPGLGRTADMPLLSARERSLLRDYFSKGQEFSWVGDTGPGIKSRDLEQALSRFNLVDPADRAAVLGNKGTIGSFRRTDSVKDLADEGLKRIVEARQAAKTNIIKSMLQSNTEGVRALGQMRVRDLGPFNPLPAVK